MESLELFIIKNHLKKKDLADYLGVSKNWITQLCQGEKPLSNKLLYKLFANEEGWDVSMLIDPNDPKTVNSVINSHDFKYDGANAELIAIIREQQAQMGSLIESLSIITQKIGEANK